MRIKVHTKYVFHCFLVPGKRAFFKAGYKILYAEHGRHGITSWQYCVIDCWRKGLDSGCHSIHDSFSPAWYRYNYLGCVSAPYGDDLWLNYIKIGNQPNGNNGLESAEPFFSGAFLERHPGFSRTEIRRNFVRSSIKKSSDFLNKQSLRLVVNFTCCIFRTVLFRCLPERSFSQDCRNGSVSLRFKIRQNRI